MFDDFNAVYDIITQPALWRNGTVWDSTEQIALSKSWPAEICQSADVSKTKYMVAATSVPDTISNTTTINLEVVENCVCILYSRVQRRPSGGTSEDNNVK